MVESAHEKYKNFITTAPSTNIRYLLKLHIYIKLLILIKFIKNYIKIIYIFKILKVQ